MKTQDTTVVYNGKPRFKLNDQLLDQQDVDKLRELHYNRLMLEDLMHGTDDPDELKTYDSIYTDIEFELQDAWGFPRNKGFHKFWERPKCRCPKLDNEDRYPTGIISYIVSCPLHGGS